MPTGVPKAGFRKPKGSKDNETLPGLEAAPNEDEVKPISGVERPAPAVPTSEGATIKRITFLVDPKSGKVALGSMRESTIKDMRDAIGSTPELFPAAVAAEMVRFPDPVVVMLYNALGSVEAYFAGKRFPQEQANIFLYTPQEIGTLMEPTQKVLTKYLSGFNRYPEETALAATLIGIHMQKWHGLQAMAAKEAAKEAKNNAVTTDIR